MASASISMVEEFDGRSGSCVFVALVDEENGSGRTTGGCLVPFRYFIKYPLRRQDAPIFREPGLSYRPREGLSRNTGSAWFMRNV